MSFREWAGNQGRLGSGKSAKVKPVNNTKREAATEYLPPAHPDGNAAMSSFNLSIFYDWCL